MRLLTIVALILFLTPMAHASMMAPPDPPPVGWEERITPGFDPPVEYLFVYQLPDVPLNYLNDDGVRELLQRWGQDPAPVLIRLLGDTGWHSYHHQILHFLLQTKSPTALEYVKGKLAQVLRVEKPAPEDQFRLSEWLDHVWQLEQSTAEQQLLEGLQHPAAPFYTGYVLHLIRRAHDAGDTAYFQQLDRVRVDAVVENQRQSVGSSLEQLAAQRRALEPMAKVPAEEKP